MKIALVGYGAMGKIVHQMAKDDIVYTCGIEEDAAVKTLSEINDKVDVVLDFSNPANLDMIYEYAIKNNTPVVIATTGYNVAQEEKITNL